jgi:hypothetical protein
MDKTKLDMNNPHHQVLVSVMATFVDDYGYSPRELFALMDHAKNQTWSALSEIAQDRADLLNNKPF